MNPCLAVLFSLVAATFGSDIYPIELFLPVPSMQETFSQKESSSSDFLKWTILSRNPYGQILTGSLIQSIDGRIDTGTFAMEWDPNIPQSGARGLGRPRRLFLSSLVNSKDPDTITTTWDPVKRTLIETTSRGGCPWRDSTVLDDRNRVVFQAMCNVSSRVVDNLGDTTTSWHVGDEFRAWYERPDDTLPRISWLRQVWPQTFSPSDSVHSIGEANRPDSLEGTSRIALSRDASGRVLAWRPRRPTADSASWFYTYDTSGRLSRQIRIEGSSIDTTWIRYPRNGDAGATSRLASAKPGFRLVRDGAQFDLTETDRVRIDLVSLDGKCLGRISDGIFGSGSSHVAFRASPGQLVVFTTSSRKIALLQPPR